MSSAYRPILCSVFPIVTPALVLVLNLQANGSTTRANKRGERGQPCLVPFSNCIASKVKLFTLRTAVGLVLIKKSITKAHVDQCAVDILD